jgi:hypothetical protein
MTLFVGTSLHLKAAVPCFGQRNSCGAVKRNITSIRTNTGSQVAPRHALKRIISHVVCHSTSQAEGSRGEAATSWAVAINRNIVIAVDASEVRFKVTDTSFETPRCSF